MSSTQRRHSTGVVDQLLETPHRFGFFQAVRLLELWLSEHDTGHDLVPSPLRFRNSTSLSFPASEIESLEWSGVTKSASLDPDALPEINITPAFMGLLGVAGTLPIVYTEYVAQRELYHKDHAARAFFDVFSHRAVALFYTAWKRSRLHLHYESEREDRFAPMVLALAGVGQGALTDRLKAKEGGVRDESLAFFAGALQQRVVSATQVQQLLKRYLGVPVAVEQFCGRWYTLPAEARSVLGLSNGVLGRNALSGERIWQRDLRARVVLGPLDHRMFRRFLPGGPGATALREVLTMLTGVSLEFEINLVLQADVIEGSSLASDRPQTAGRLGWDTYLQTRPSAVDRCDVSYDIQAAA